jgi:hypothetical protein
VTDSTRHDALDPETDSLYDALAIKSEGWTLRDSATGEEFEVSREQLAQLLADNRRRLERDNPLTTD